MTKSRIEFINTCSCCDGYGEILRNLVRRFPDKIDLSIYYAGKDFDYLPKYGPISRGTLIINEQDRYEDLSRRIIEQVVGQAIGETV